MSCKHLRSIGDAFYSVPDHRDARTRRHPKIALYTIIVHGLLTGSPSVKAIWNRSTAFDQTQRKALGLTQRNKEGRLYMPGYDAINDFVNGIDSEELARVINLWLASHQDKLPKSLALDGKDLGHSMGGIVTLCRHEDGRPVAMASYSGAKEDCELPVAQKMLKENASSLENATITSDALHTQKKTTA